MELYDYGKWYYFAFNGENAEGERIYKPLYTKDANYHLREANLSMLKSAGYYKFGRMTFINGFVIDRGYSQYL